MHHPSLGLPPSDATAGHPSAAAQLRSNAARLARTALQEALRLAPELKDRYDETDLRLFLRDYDRHIEQLARALETGEDSYVVTYAEWLVPIYRRRHVPMADFMLMVDGLRAACAAVLSPDENDAAQALFDRWNLKLKRHQRLPGDHKGNPIIRFFFKGAGIGDDKWI
jgi:hypothetical protein